MQTASETSGRRIIWLISFAGFVSGLATILILWFWTIVFPGLVFGLVLAAFFGKLGIFTERQAGWFIAVSAVAHIISFYLVLRWSLDSPSRSNPDDASLLAFLAGGVLGGFLVLGALPLILDNRRDKHAVIAGALPWAIGGAALGGGLAVVGVLLGPSLGTCVVDLFHVLHLLPFEESEPSKDWYSLYLVWQVGIAFALGLIARRYRADSRTKEIEQP